MPAQPFNIASASQPDSDGYTPGQRDRALVLDLFAKWDRAGTCSSAWDHPATKLADEDVNAACDALVTDGYLVPDWPTLPDGQSNLTPIGLAAHAAAQRAMAELDARIEASQRFAHLAAERCARLGVACTPEEVLADLDAKIAALPSAADPIPMPGEMVRRDQAWVAA